MVAGVGLQEGYRLGGWVEKSLNDLVGGLFGGVGVRGLRWLDRTVLQVNTISYGSIWLFFMWPI